MGDILLLLLGLYVTSLNTFVGAISSPTKVNNENTIDGPLRISSYLAPLAGDTSLMLYGTGLFEKEVVELLASVLNFTFMPHKPPDVVAIGLKTANGSWNGCMGELVRQEIDLCVSFAQTWQVPDKHEAVDFTFPIIFDYFGMLMPAPVQRSKAYTLFETFSKETWTCLLVSAILMTIILWGSYLPNPELRPLQMPLSRWFLFVISALTIGERGYVMRHGGGEKGFSLVYRQSLVFWCLPAMVLLNSYKAIFFALLSTPQYNYLIGGIDDLHQRENQINVYDIKGSAIDDLFMTQPDASPLTWVRDHLIKHPERRLNQNELNQVFDIIKDNNVFCGPKIGLCHAFADMDRKNNKPSRLHVSKQMSFPRGRSMIVQKGGPLKPMLDKECFYETILQHDITYITACNG